MELKLWFRFQLFKPNSKERKESLFLVASFYTGLLIWLMCTVVNQSLWQEKFGSLIGQTWVTCSISGGRWCLSPSPQATWTVSGVERSFKDDLGPFQEKNGEKMQGEGYKNNKDPPKLIYFISFNSLQSIHGPVEQSLLFPVAESWMCQVNTGT